MKNLKEKKMAEVKQIIIEQATQKKIDDVNKKDIIFAINTFKILIKTTSLLNRELETKDLNDFYRMFLKELKRNYNIFEYQVKG